MRHLSLMAVIAALALPSVASNAQTAPADQHKGHHPGQTQAAPATPGTMGGGATAGGMMGHGMMGHGMMGGMRGKYIEGRLAFLKAEIRITPAQEGQWSKFADAVRASTKAAAAGAGMDSKPASAPERLAGYEKHLMGRLETVRALKAAFDPLYGSLSDEQKKIADELVTGPMGVL